MEEQKMKHVCKFCKKRFACGRSLGGHIRCHLPKPGYKLRENPKKTWRVVPGDHATTSFEIETESIRLMKVNEDHGKSKRSSHVGNNSHSCVSEVVEEEQQDENDVAMCLIMLSRDVSPWGGGKNSKGNSSKNKRKRRSKVFTGVNKDGVRIADSEKMMKKELKMKGVEVLENGLFSNDQSFNLRDKIEEFTVGENVENGVKLEKFGEYDYMNVMNSERFKITTPDKNDCKRSKFECTTCNKLFHSYQALGGHKASHKRQLMGSNSNSNSNDQEQAPQEKDQVFTDVSLGLKSMFSKKAVQKHECQICFRIFPSGQALGGHKRSHLLDSNNTEAKISDQNDKIDGDVIERSSSNSEIRDNMLDLDLNLAPIHVQEEGNTVITTASSSNSLVGMIKPYWWVENPNKNEPFLSLMPN